MHEMFRSIDKKIIRRAWLEAKQVYIENRNAFSRAELVTYEELFRRRNIFRNRLRLMEGRISLTIGEIADGVQFMSKVDIDY